MKLKTIRTWWYVFTIIGLAALILGYLGEYHNIGYMTETEGMTFFSMALLMPCWIYVGITVNKKDLAGDKK